MRHQIPMASSARQRTARREPWHKLPCLMHHSIVLASVLVLGVLPCGHGVPTSDPSDIAKSAFEVAQHIA